MKAAQALDHGIADSPEAQALFQKLKNENPTLSDEEIWEQVMATLRGPKSDEEQEERHRILHPGTSVPPRGTGMKFSSNAEALESIREFARETEEEDPLTGKAIGKKEDAPKSPTAGFHVGPVLSKHYAMFMPVTVKAARGIAGVQDGDWIVEGTISLDIKDLHGEQVEYSALVEAKNAMVKPPHNLVWLDHFSPYTSAEASDETPIGRFVASKIVQDKQGTQGLWARMLVNKVHPEYKTVLYELRKGFRNAFSMEFVPLKEGLKTIGDKVVNAISSIKYLASCLVRAPAAEGATIDRVYQKAFTNSSQFCSVRVKSVGGIGQYARMKGEIRKLVSKQAQSATDEQLTDEEEERRKREEEEQEEQQGQPKDYGPRILALEKALLTISKNMALIGKSLKLRVRGIDEPSPDPITDENASESVGESEPPEVPKGESPAPDEDEVLTGEGAPVEIKWLGRFIANEVRARVKRELDRHTVVRKGIAEHMMPTALRVKRLQQLTDHDGSIESQLELIDSLSG